MVVENLHATDENERPNSVHYCRSKTLDRRYSHAGTLVQERESPSWKGRCWAIENHRVVDELQRKHLSSGTSLVRVGRCALLFVQRPNANPWSLWSPGNKFEWEKTNTWNSEHSPQFQQPHATGSIRSVLWKDSQHFQSEDWRWADSERSSRFAEWDWNEVFPSSDPVCVSLHAKRRSRLNLAIWSKHQSPIIIANERKQQSGDRRESWRCALLAQGTSAFVRVTWLTFEATRNSFPYDHRLNISPAETSAHRVGQSWDPALWWACPITFCNQYEGGWYG